MLQRLMHLGLFALLAGAIVVVAPVMAQEQKPAAPKPKMDRLSGRVHMVDKAASTIEIMKGNVHRKIVYSDSTKWTSHNKPASMADMQDGSAIVAVGKFNDKAQLVATRIEISRK